MKCFQVVPTEVTVRACKEPETGCKVGNSRDWDLGAEWNQPWVNCRTELGVSWHGTDRWRLAQPIRMDYPDTSWVPSLSALNSPLEFSCTCMENMFTSILYMGIIILRLCMLKHTQKFKEDKIISRNKNSNISTPFGDCED